ncbi:hypothetical protein ACK8P5_02135 [Paenibacillus sp. EC2-1]|uniref:hypothetical protein n=1 Tax=Paenibacillus sp. EC2-1 TaxID=3388665 RepID=UPI003BEF29F8
MRRRCLVIFAVFFMVLITACNRSEEPKILLDNVEETGPSSEVPIETSVKIDKVYTDAKTENGWWVVNEDAETLTIYVEAQNVDAVIFWSAPTGTETGKERELIGYDVDGDDGWSFEWNIKGRNFHHHIGVQALGMDGSSLASETFNLHTLSEYDN